jgi:hypothetical protein
MQTDCKINSWLKTKTYFFKKGSVYENMWLLLKIQEEQILEDNMFKKAREWIKY